MKTLEFGVGYINGGKHKPIHSSYSAKKVLLGLSQVERMLESDDREHRAFASYWLDAISFKLKKEAEVKRVLGKWTMEDAQEHDMLIERLHVVKEAEIRANLERPMSEEEMPSFVLREYEKIYPKDSEIGFLLKLTDVNKSSSSSEFDELLGVRTYILDV